MRPFLKHTKRKHDSEKFLKMVRISNLICHFEVLFNDEKAASIRLLVFGFCKLTFGMCTDNTIEQKNPKIFLLKKSKKKKMD